MKTRIVLLAINSKYIHSSLAVWLIAAGIEKHARIPYEVSILEATIHQTCNVIADNVSAFKPDIIGVSAYIWNARILPGLLAGLRGRLPEARIVLGGPEAEHNIGYWIEQGADCVLPGEGELTFPAYLNSLSCAGGPGNLSSSLYAPPEQSPQPGHTPQKPSPQPEHTQPELSPQPEYTQPELSPQPERSPPESALQTAYLASLKGRIAYLETSRGCPFACAYCLSAGTGVRYFPMESVKPQILRLSRSEAKTVKLTDRTFNSDAVRAKEIFEYVISLSTSACFHFEVAADLFDEQALSLLGTAPPGRIQLEAGLQSFCEPALNAVSRKTNLKKAERKIKALLRNGNIHVHIDLIAGLPYETLEYFKLGFDRAYALKAHTLQLGFLKLLHGSVLRADAGNLGLQYDLEAPYEIQSTPWLTVQDIQTLKHTENALQNTRNKSRFLQTLDYTISASGMSPFSFFRALGEAAPHSGASLTDYAVRIFGFCAALPGICKNELKDKIACDWLAMVKGKNKPPFLKTPDGRHKQIMKLAEQRLGHEVRREEVSILSTGAAVYADSQTRNPVTGLYKTHMLFPPPP